jgi:glycosyltransferase involved in cell wall biosynthesis
VSAPATAVRIAHLVTGGEVAGGQAVALRLARAARARGDDAFFVSPTTGAFTAAAAADGFTVELVDVSRTFRLAGAVRLRKILRRRHVDVLHTHVHLAAGVLGRLAARSAGCVVVSHLHIENHLRESSAARFPLVALDNATARLCARLVAVSEATRAAFERQGFPSRLLETVPNSIDLAALESVAAVDLRRELALSPDSLLVGQVGRLAPVKGQRDLLGAFAAIRERHPGAHVVLVGSDDERGGAYAAELEADARDLRVADAVHLLGFRTDALGVMRAFDALVLPSRIEGMPLAVLEAMALATPVVATAAGGTGEVVDDGRTGLLVPVDDAEALAKALDRLLADAGLRDELGRAARIHVAANFDARVHDRRILDIYDEAVARRS